MLHKNAVTKQKEQVVSYAEIFLLFFAFLGMLIFLYPKDSLQKQVLAEKSNYDLTAIYLNNLIRLNPDNSELIFVMAKTLYQQEKYDLAINLLKVLNKDPKDEISQNATILHLQINNIRLEKEENKTIRQAITKENSKLLKSVAHSKSKDKNSTMTLYHAAIATGDKKTALSFNRNILNFTDKDEHIKWLKNYHYLASELNNQKEDIYALKELVKKDTNKTEIWLNTLLPQLDKNTDMKVLVKELNLTKVALANLYLSRNKYDKAILVYKKLLKDEKNTVKRKKLLLTLINIYKSNNNPQKAAKIAHQHEDEYINDSQMTNKLLKLYLEANRPDLASNLSLKIIKQKGIR